MINVVGLGYIGLPTALMLAKNGNKVVGTDVNGHLISNLNKGIITFEEDHLEKVFNQAVENGIDFSSVCISTDTYIITVPTPYNLETKEIDPQYVIQAVQDVLKVCLENTIIVIESTISPGTVQKYIEPLIKRSKFVLNESIFLAHAPERIIPGNMIFELINNPRTIGADKREVGQKIKKIYSTFCQGQITLTSIKTAEISKVVENTYRAVNIAFANELLKICNSSNLDVKDIIDICNQHPRVNILSPGPGVGGHCIPVDPWFLVGDYPHLTNLILTALEINESMPEYVMKRINKIASIEKIKDHKRIGIYGLTYKSDVDDVRESPALQLFNKMKEYRSESFISYDPMLKETIDSNQVMFFDEFLDEVDFIIIMVGHKHIIENQHLLKNKIVLDTQGIISSAYHL